MAIQAVRGTSDLLGDDVKRWSAAEHAARRLARLYGYAELRTPLIEDAKLFLRSLGETTDLIQKEMFQFKDRGDHDIVLRPEGTAPVVRAYLEHNLHKTQGFAKLFYLGPMFRAERPQAGRFRQFHQFGVEAIGSHSPWVDVEVIVLCQACVRACGVTDAVTWLSSMGCRDDQQRSASELRSQLEDERTKLCPDCQKRFERNVFRVLDCRKDRCQNEARAAIARIRSKTGYPILCDSCTTHFDTVRGGLRDAGVTFDDTQVFARGLDYYTRTVFEVRAKGLGAQDAVAAGGRYDHLVEEFGGPPSGACGFAAGIERLLLAATKPPSTETPPRQGIYLATAQPAFVNEGFRFAQQLRALGVGAVLDYDGRSLKAQLREADKAGCRLVAILGEQELKRREVTVKDLEEGGPQDTIGFDVFAQEIAKRLKTTACH
ncbi:MAG: histidine--tRNA ligase [Candidatus Omnitrophica bacterium]|nr:histidine--tRNA ligase [Candidatus Omnitrophota bacterium]